LAPPEAAFGYDAMKKQTFYGLRGHVAVTWPGVIHTAELAPANTHDLEMAPHVLYGARGWALADSNYWSPGLFDRLEPGLFDRLEEDGLTLLAPSKSQKGSPKKKALKSTKGAGRDV
jgi:hypothetical protein